MQVPQQHANERPGKQALLIALLLALITFATFLGVSKCGFVSYDDPDYVQQNKMVQGGLTWPGIQWAFTAGHAANWHPLTWMTHMMDCELYGLEPAGHHITNLLFHVANTVLVFLLFYRMTGGLWQSAFTAALFGVHPLHVESVAWLSERKDVLSTFFALLSMMCYARYGDPRKPLGSKQPALYYVLALVLFACGLMSKPMIVTLPFVFILLDYWPLRRLDVADRRSWIRIIGEKTPFFVLSAISSYVTVQVQAGKTIQSLANFGLLDRVSNVLVSYALYLWKMIWPAKLAFFYPLVSAPPLWQAAVAAAVLLGITIAVIVFAKRFPQAIVGWFWYLGTLVPVIGIVHVGEQALADRYTYVPLIGIFFAIAWTVPQVLPKRSHTRTTYWAATALILAACMMMTVRQVGFWESNRIMLERALAVTKENFLAHNNYGVVLADEGRLDEAIGHYEEAVRIKPAYARAFNNMGTALTYKGNFDAAIQSYLKSISIAPHEPQTHHNLAVTYGRAGRFDLTIEHCREALRLNPDYSAAYYDLALALNFTGKFDEAKTFFLKSLETEPSNVQTHLQLAKIYLRKQDIRSAAAHFRTALTHDPSQLNAAAMLMWILATAEDPSLRNGSEALVLIERLDPAICSHPMVMRSMAAAYAELGRYAEAVSIAEKALSGANDANLQQLLETDLRSYRAGKPIRSM